MSDPMSVPGAGRRGISPRLVRWTRGVAAASFLTAWWQVKSFVADDTYIHLTYARNLRDGHGMVFNLGERVYGTTAPLWTLALGLLGRTGVDLLVLAKALSLVFGLATVFVGSVALDALLAIWKDRHPLDPTIVRLAWAAGTLALGLDVWLVRWSASGMESSLAAFLITAGFLAEFRGVAARSTRAAAWWWALAALVRPEASLLVVLLALQTALEPEVFAERWRALRSVLIPPALLGGAWLGYAGWFYGTVLPTAFASKAVERTPPLENLLVQAHELAADRGVEIVALLASLSAEPHEQEQ